MGSWADEMEDMPVCKCARSSIYENITYICLPSWYAFLHLNPEANLAQTLEANNQQTLAPAMEEANDELTILNLVHMAAAAWEVRFHVHFWAPFLELSRLTRSRLLRPGGTSIARQATLYCPPRQPFF